jgi:elongator complex protein 3
MYKKIGYTPYDDETIKKILTEMLQEIPDYCRVMRIMREIPKEKMKTKAANTSIRGELHKDLEKIGGIKEIRMREVGFQNRKVKLDVQLKTIEYDASNGKEFFLEMVNSNDVLFGLLRLRFPDETIVDELEGCAIVRELHVYGQALKLGEKGELSQHKGLGKELMAEAEDIARDAGYKKIAVISGVGVRKYYEKLGYNLEGTYMTKNL